MKVIKQKIEQAVKNVLADGLYPTYETFEHALTQEEYINFVTEVLNKISATEKELA